MKQIVVFVILCFLFLGFPQSALAITDPFSRPNNFFGIHILFPSELHKAKELVNSTNGDWGYVTIPIQVGDKDIDKWQEFMNDCYDLHLIPLIRLATESFYKDTATWRQPTEDDILDFANFLNSLYWPVKNRYVILFNEVNRFDEWGGNQPDPVRYAEIADYAIDVFKTKNSDFFMILSGLDNASVNTPGKYINEFDYFRSMYNFRPTLFSRIDGVASHSYPNPNFSDAPNDFKKVGISTYKFEQDLIDSFTISKKPFFITETGWNNDTLSEDTISSYYSKSFSEIWERDSGRIVAITPFLLLAGNGPFGKFSFLKNDQFKKFAINFQNLSKVRGDPEIVIPPPPLKSSEKILGIKDFKKMMLADTRFSKLNTVVKFYFKSILGI